MLFNSLVFLVFLPMAFLAYWALARAGTRVQNMLVLAASYVFYAWWDWRFLGLLVFSSLCDHLVGGALGSTGHRGRRRFLLAVSLLVNLGLLGFFKYFNFFIGGFSDILLAVGMRPHLPTLQIILPVGISFYTFQTLSYTIDIYRGLIRPTRDPIAFFAFVAFFPQLVAGPIERARDLLPQFLEPRSFNMALARDGLRQMLWGLFKKVAIADACAPMVNSIFAGDPATTPGITLFFGAFFFAFQIYGDFSGYSDMAIGTARLFGFRLSQNFAYPYFARSIGEFWRRWHITLSAWFRDYVYIPLGGWRNRMGRARNIMITFAVSGLWHGANWTFVGWGMLHGLYHLPAILTNKRALRDDPTLRDLPSMVATFLLVTLAWVFFRTDTLRGAADHLLYMVINLALHPGALLLHLLREEMVLIIILLVAEWRRRREAHALVAMSSRTVVRWVIYLLLITLILVKLDLHTVHEFIYFRF
jgi:alginate O-acetyltransferase complex protein AlgI